LRQSTWEAEQTAWVFVLSKGIEEELTVGNKYNLQIHPNIVLVCGSALSVPMLAANQRCFLLA